jgi:hypothetical protein
MAIPIEMICKQSIRPSTVPINFVATPMALVWSNTDAVE